jgi:hypothetical protein
MLEVKLKGKEAIEFTNTETSEKKICFLPDWVEEYYFHINGRQYIINCNGYKPGTPYQMHPEAVCLDPLPVGNEKSKRAEVICFYAKKS